MDDKQIIALSQAHGEVTGGRLNDLGKKLFMWHKRMAWLGHHCLTLLTIEVRAMIMVRKQMMYTWYDPESGETIKDGLIILFLILQKIRPNVRINVFNEISKLKELKPKQFNFNIVQWLSELKAKRLSIELKIPGAYHNNQFIMDIFVGVQETPCKSLRENRFHEARLEPWRQP